MVEDFTWLDGERLIRFGERALDDAPRLLHERGFQTFALLATDRSVARVPELRRRAATVLEVPAGQVPPLAAALRERVRRLPVVGVGGGRVVDVAKAIAAVEGAPCAAVPTTLSGAEMTPFHRLPDDAAGARPVRPGLVVGEPELMASQPMPALAASAMNALGHAVESLYVRHANPVSELAALRAAALVARGLSKEPPAPHDLALGALLAGYAIGTTGYGIHHVVCQSTVRVTGAPHAETNAVMLPHSVRAMEGRAPAALGRLAAALGAGREEPGEAAELVAALASRAGVTRLDQIGVGADALGAVAAAASGRPQLDNIPAAPGEGEILDLLRGAL